MVPKIKNIMDQILRERISKQNAFHGLNQENELRFTYPKLKGNIGPHMSYDEKEMIIWSINDYINIANHKEVLALEKELIEQHSLSYPMGSRIMSGNIKEHEHLEERLAKHVEKESALLLNLGYPGIFSVIDSLLTRHDIVIYDEECHASTIDGIRLHRGIRMPYRHNNINSLKHKLNRAVNIIDKSGYILIITEGVFSMKGNFGILKQISELKEVYNFLFLVDDSHGFGVFGEKGKGTGSYFGVQDSIDLYFSTFTKALATLGGFIASSEPIIHFLKYSVRSQIFGRALPFVITKSLTKRLEIMQSSDAERYIILKKASILRKRLIELNYNVGQDNSPIVCVHLTITIERALSFISKLRDEFNIFCSGITYPAIPKGELIIRLVVTFNHSFDDIERTLFAFQKLRKRSAFFNHSMILSQ